MTQKTSDPVTQINKSSQEFVQPPQQIARNFRDLLVYQKAFSVSLDVHQLSLTFPKHELFALGDQLRRSTKSICANIAEGFDKQQSSKAEFK